MSEFPQACGACDPVEASGRSPVAAPEARQEIESVLSALRQWLLESEQWRLAVVTPEEPGEAAPSVDLHALVGEWIALKQEVRLESRVGKTTREHLERAVEAFHEGVDRVHQHVPKLLDPLVRERDRLRDDLGTQLESQQRSWVELLLDVREALVRGGESVRRAGRRLRWRRWLLPRGLLTGLLEGNSLAVQRIDTVLESRGVRRIECVGQRVDPERMRVVDIVPRRDVPEGHVVEVLRQGYVCGSRIIRYAEVRAAGRGTAGGREDPRPGDPAAAGHVRAGNEQTPK